MKKITLTVGIPAFNEENNIGNLVKAILKQSLTKNMILKKIIVVSDGSTDKTVDILHSVRTNKLKVLEFKRRLGIANAQNEIVKKTSEDILVILNGDILPQGRFFLQNIIKPFLNDKKVGIVGADTLSLKPKTIVEKLISDSHSFKVSMYKKLNDGNSVYLCHGRGRAFSKSFYKKIHWPAETPEDAFSFLYCMEKGLKFVFANNAKVLFRSPANFYDHSMQSKRFFKGNEILKKYFPKKIVTEAFYIPKKIFVKELISFVVGNPISALGYLFITIVLKFTKREKINLSKWEISKSSKLLSVGVKLIL